MISSFAWRNLWRNKLRSFVIITAVTLGIFAGIFLMAFMNGMVNDRIQTIISTEISHIQIHRPGFVESDLFTLRIANADSVVDVVKRIPNVSAASKRIVINSMAASAETGTGVKITGIDPESEKKVTRLYTKIFEGKYLDGTGKNSIIIGETLAKKLKVGLKNKFIITVQDVKNNITGGAFRVVGIYWTDNNMFDGANVYVRNSDISALTGLDGKEAHEVAILLSNKDATEEAGKAVAAGFPQLEVKDWLRISPEAGYLVSAMNQYMYIFMVVILLALCFGIINTMLMVIMERVRELGMLMAIGMNKLKVFMMIMLETVYLSLTGGVLGIIGGYFVTRYFEHAGINLFFWKEAFASLGYSAMVYPVIEPGTMVIVTIMVIVTGILSSLYPAYKALKLNPSQAIRS